MAGHLLHIGYPKAASTFLQAWFEAHPQLRYVPGGLGGFRNVYELSLAEDSKVALYVTSYEGLAIPFRPLKAVAPRGLDEIPPLAPVTETRRQVCDMLKTLFPSSRVLIVTRGFRSMLISGYSQYVRTGGGYRLRELYERLSELVPMDAFEYWDYDNVVRLYADAFGEENVIVLPFELLRDDPNAFLSALEDRLEVAHHEIEPGRRNPSLSPAELHWYPVISQSVARLSSRLPRRLGGRLQGSYLSSLLRNRFSPLVKALHAFMPRRVIVGDDFPTEVLRHCRGRADLLRNDPLYAPYTSEYLWDDE